MPINLIKIQEDLQKYVRRGENNLHLLAESAGMSDEETSLLINTASGTNGSKVAIMIRLNEFMKELLTQELESKRPEMLEELRDFVKYHPTDLFDIAVKAEMSAEKVVDVIIKPESSTWEVYLVFEAMRRRKDEISNAVNILNSYISAHKMEAETEAEPSAKAM